MSNSFLIAFKPASENLARGWPLENLQALVKRLHAGERVEEAWRFANRKEVRIGDRAFLLLQGKGGPAIIGKGLIAGTPHREAGKWAVPIHFEQLVDPTHEVLLGAADLRTIPGSQRSWNTQSSGVKLPVALATELERLTTNVTAKPRSIQTVSNPDWSRDELILALDVYLTHRTKLPNRESHELLELSRQLERLGKALFRPAERSDTFRNINGVYMKLMNFSRLDPQYTSQGRTGLSRGAKAEEEVWADFSEDPERCRAVARAIIASLDDAGVSESWKAVDEDDGVQEAAEGRLLTRKHVFRERNRKLVASKRKQVMKRFGNLACEVCNFDFSIRYGNRGAGFIECHHIKPVAMLAEGQKTHIDDLAVVCANCHRMIHAQRPWLSIGELKRLLHSGPAN